MPRAVVLPCRKRPASRFAQQPDNQNRPEPHSDRCRNGIHFVIVILLLIVIPQTKESKIRIKIRIMNAAQQNHTQLGAER